MTSRGIAAPRRRLFSYSVTLSTLNARLTHAPKGFIPLLLLYLNFYNLFFLFLFSETGQVDSVLIERYNTPGFVGCLSRVQFNRIAPLKAALRPSAPSTASVQGVLVESNCGALPLTIPAMSVTFNPWQPESGEDDEDGDCFYYRSFIYTRENIVAIMTVITARSASLPICSLGFPFRLMLLCDH